jgi:hypothetical protein
MTCYLPYGVERFLCKILMNTCCIVLPFFAIGLILGVFILFGTFLQDIWTSKCLNPVKQCVQEASKSIIQSLKARSSSRGNEISAKMREIEVNMIRNTALLLEVKAKVRCPFTL